MGARPRRKERYTVCRASGDHPHYVRIGVYGRKLHVRLSQREDAEDFWTYPAYAKLRIGGATPAVNERETRRSNGA